MADVQVRHVYAKRQMGSPRRLSTTRSRRPAKAASTPAELPSGDGKSYVRLDRGKYYHLVSAELTFQPGEVVEVTEEVHAHLANAIDELPTLQDPSWAGGPPKKKIRCITSVP